MLFETPEDTYESYKRFSRKEEYKKAYRCLEKMLHEFPNDIQLLEDIVDLCINFWRKPEIGRRWLLKLVRIRKLWVDYTLLSHVEAELENIGKAKEYFKIAKKLQKSQEPQGWLIKTKKEYKKIFLELEDFIKYKEGNNLAKIPFQPKIKVEVRVEDERSHQPQKSEDEIKKPLPPPPTLEKPLPSIPSYTIPIKIEPFNEDMFTSILKGGNGRLQENLLLIDYEYLAIQSGFDELLCLNSITDVEKYWYQIETVKKVLRYFHGRVLLCDEVGLGKTIEAGMLIKEYIMRGMVKNVLILTPASLVSQWRDEMQAKFGIEFLTTENAEFSNDPVSFWKERFIIASINTAKGSKNMSLVTEQLYDLVVVDEAHHLRNRATLAWSLVNRIKKRFILLLTATPVQNNLIELFNLITLLKPGQFKTEREFKKEYVSKGSLKATADKEKLRGLLRDVMIRNTRSVIDIKLPKRFAATIRLEPTDAERGIYTKINEYLKKDGVTKLTINLLLREAGSSPFALKSSLLKMCDKNGASARQAHDKDIIDAIDSLKDICKGKSLIEILMKNPDEKKIIFTQFVKSMDYITDLLWRHEIPHVTFSGDLTPKEKNSAIASFKNDVPVLLSTESGGEGRNLQFCNTIINFDLPWNPMRIEQRIGRLHRIGQTRDVFIFNLAIKETIEDYIIDILDRKINMFEMIIGEIEPILGHLGEDIDFEDIIVDIWLKSGDKEGLKGGFEQLGNELVNAKQRYLDAKAVDEEIFGEDYEI